MIERRLDLTWTTPNGAAIWALDEELIGLMRQAGCHHLTLAVESGSQDVLRNIIRKPLALSRVRPIVDACRSQGMGVSLFFVVGFPGERKADIQRTFDFAMSLDADQACFFTATPYPGTELFEQCLALGLLRRPVDYTTLRVGRPMFGTADWSADELADMTRAAQARFYRRTAVRRPVRFFAAAAAKFLREPRVTLAKARDALLPHRLQINPT
jgi:magnesium-protoporphyrin IX monomethyl ester (oxidative) cyclase